MKNLKDILKEGQSLDLYEGILDDVEVALGKDASEAIYKIPTVKDFQKSPYNHSLFFVDWDLSNVIDMYNKRYPKLLIHNWSKLRFVIMRDIGKKYAVLVYNAEGGLNSKRMRLMGWEEILNYSIRTCREWVIELIEHLAENPDKLDELFKHSDKMKNEVGPFCQNTPLSKLLY